MPWSALPQFVLLYCLSVRAINFQPYSNPHSLSRPPPQEPHSADCPNGKGVMVGKGPSPPLPHKFFAHASQQEVWESHVSLSFWWGHCVSLVPLFAALKLSPRSHQRLLRPLKGSLFATQSVAAWLTAIQSQGVYGILEGVQPFLPPSPPFVIIGCPLIVLLPLLRGLMHHLGQNQLGG